MTMDYEARKRWLTNNLKVSLKTKMESYTFGRRPEHYKSIQFTFFGYIDEDWCVKDDFDNEFERAYLRAIKTMNGLTKYYISKENLLPAIRKIKHYSKDLIIVSVNPAIHYVKEYTRNGIVEDIKVIELGYYGEQCFPISLVFLQKKDLPYVPKTPDGNLIIEFTKSDDEPFLEIGHDHNAKAIQLVIAQNGEKIINSIEDIKNIWNNN